MSRYKSPPKKSQNFAEQLFSLPIADISPIQQTAMNLWHLGFNVFPQLWGKKGGLPWGMLQYTRLNAEDIYPLFRDNCNIAIMTGRTSDNLFVIDCETKWSFKSHEQLLKDAGIPIWAVATNGRGNGGHFYLRCSDGEVANIKPGERKGYEVRGNRCYVLCPPSLHPETRQFYDWHQRDMPAPPVVSASQVHWLGLTIAHEVRGKQKIPQPFATLSALSRDFILNGAAYGERNNRLFAAACDLAGNDYDEHQAHGLLLPIAVRNGTPEREARDTIRSAYSKPRTPARPITHSHTPTPAWEKAQSWAQTHRWHDRIGQTDKAVFLACCERAKTASETGVFRAASREIAEIARTTRKTVSISLKRLTEANLLIACGVDRDSKAALYRLSPPTQKERDLSRYYPTNAYTSLDSGVTTRNLSDAFERAALGKTAHAVYVTLLSASEPVRQKQLVTLTCLSKDQVSRSLKKLVATGVVTKSNRLYKVVSMTSQELDEKVARPAGTQGKGEKRKRDHAHDRAARAGERLYKARFGKGYQRSKPTASLSSGYICGNCGQVWQMLGLEPPMTCDFCGGVDPKKWSRKKGDTLK